MLFHSSLPNFPRLIIPDKKIKLDYSSRHVDTRAWEKNIRNLPESVNFRDAEIFEIETDNTGKLVKVCIRIAYNNNYDLCMPILVDGFIVKTVWLNSKNDSHVTLDITKYENGKGL